MIHSHSSVIDKSEDDSDDDLIVGNDLELDVEGLDYKAVFEQCSFPVGVAALDGRFLRCNSKFEAMTGLSKRNLESSTLFGLLSTDDTDEVFQALGTLLKDCDSSSDDAGTSASNSNSNDRACSGDESPASSSHGANGHGHCISEDKHSESSGDDNAISSGDDSGLTTVANRYWTGNLSRPNENVSARNLIEIQ